MKKTLLIITLFITGVCFGQTYDHIEFYDDGISPKVIKTYKESKGMLELVKAITWYENGQKWLEEAYKDGKLDGKWVDWYENGQKRTEFTYKDGKEHGLSTIWYENGEKVSEETFKDGEEDGVSTGWYENGQKEYEGTYKDGKEGGLWTEWHDDGQKRAEFTYKGGEVISEKCWDKDGYERECYSMKRLWLK